MLFCCNIKTCCDLCTLDSEQEVHYYIVYIAYCTELNVQICNYAQKRRICRENSKYTPDKKIVAIFAFAERLPTSATLLSLTFWPGPIKKTVHELETVLTQKLCKS